jgi:RNA polymerase sigma-70 factor, ECF subfamily
MKGGSFSRHSPFEVNGLAVMPANLEAKTAPAASATSKLDLLSIHAEHADFVWVTLQRLGVRDADIEDLLQEVFVVVHRRLHTFDGSSRMTTWLFGISVRVAAAYRRRAHRRREDIGDPPEAVDDAATPEEVVAERQARARLQAILDAMDLEKRALFVMFEIDEVPCSEIAELLGLPIGTVYSRLHAARADFEAALRRFEARASSRGPWRGGRS